MKNVVVCKFGGSRMETPEKIIQAAQQIKEFCDHGKKVIAVVSARGNTTNQLTEQAFEISKQPSRRELDMLLSTGERVSTSLLTMALHELGLQAISFTGSQAGILSDSHHGNARIKDIKPIRVVEELNIGKVVVIAGFQAVDPKTKEVTTLGRGGSDTTAIALAAHFKAEACYMFKDVDGVCTLNPKQFRDSHKFNKISYNFLKEICFSGSQVIHYRCAALAERLKIKMFVGSKPELSTSIGDSGNYEDLKLISINCLKKVLSFELREKKEFIEFLNWCDSNNIPHPQLLACNNDSYPVRFMISGDNEILTSIENSLDNSDCPIRLISHSSAVHLNFQDSTHPELLPKVFKLLTSRGIKILKIISSAQSISVFCPLEKLDEATEALNELI